MTVLHIDAPPSEVRARLGGALHRTEGLWFHTGDSRRAWVAASSPLFVQWTGPDRARVGPRLGSPDVSRFVPLWRVRLSAERAGTRVELRWGLDPLTLVLAAFWTVMLALGGAYVTGRVAAGEVGPGAMGWWVFLVLVLGLVAAVSAVMGGRALREALPWLEEVLSTPAVEEEWV